MLKPQEVIDKYYLETRCMLLESAAMLDRYQASVKREGSTASDESKLEVLREAFSILARDDRSDDRTKQLLELFARV
ncbi:MAG: hypothetical protein AAGA18_05070 [Verrucomicrobiota bacterium]